MTFLQLINFFSGDPVRFYGEGNEPSSSITKFMIPVDSSRTCDSELYSKKIN